MVEDDAAAADVLATHLATVGHQVTLAATGTEAMRLLADAPLPDLLLLDWMLPGMSGLEICRAARERWAPLDLPILMVTARTDSRSLSAAFEAGASDYLTKPFLGLELRARVALHLGLRRMAVERRRFDELMLEREKLSVLGLVASGVAHDLNNPLGGIAGITQLLLEEEDDPRTTSLLKRVLSEVQRCNRIVGDLLSFARRNPRELQEVDLLEVLRKTIELREHALRDGGFTVELDLPDRCPGTEGDEHQLQQVLLNIILNAEQALHEGGGRLFLRLRTVTEREGEFLSLEVGNDGPPIPAEVLPRIFDPFFTTKRASEGTGLGLAICHRIVREHGGTIQVSSDERETVFEIRLPVAGEPH